MSADSIIYVTIISCMPVGTTKHRSFFYIWYEENNQDDAHILFCIWAYSIILFLLWAL